MSTGLRGPHALLTLCSGCTWGCGMQNAGLAEMLLLRMYVGWLGDGLRCQGGGKQRPNLTLVDLGLYEPVSPQGKVVWPMAAPVASKSGNWSAQGLDRCTH